MSHNGILGEGPIRSRALALYEGETEPHHSCGIALARAFGRSTPPYQALRRGGIDGEGQCGAVLAGQLILGELLGDPDPTAPVTPQLRSAMTRYRDRSRNELDRGSSPDLVCRNLTAPLGAFSGPDRHRFCAKMVGQAAQLVDEELRRAGYSRHGPDTESSRKGAGR